MFIPLLKDEIEMVRNQQPFILFDRIVALETHLTFFL